MRLSEYLIQSGLHSMLKISQIISELPGATSTSNCTQFQGIYSAASSEQKQSFIKNCTTHPMFSQMKEKTNIHTVCDADLLHVQVFILQSIGACLTCIHVHRGLHTCS